MRTRHYRAMLGGLVAALAAAGGASASYDRNSAVPLATAMTSVCSLGDAPLTKGSTPTAIAGVTIVSPQQAKCLIDHYDTSLLVIGAMGDAEQLPDAYPVPILGSDKEDAAFTQRVATDFTPLTGGNKARPILIYCHHASCQFSANGAQHLVNMGYSRVYWLRDGMKGWTAAKYALAAQPRVPAGQSAAYFYFQAARAYTFPCFGEADPAGCRMKTDLLRRSYTAADAKPEEKPVILGELLNAVAVRGGYLRTGGSRSSPQPADLKTSLAVLEDGRAIMTQAYANGARPEAILQNLKLPQELALTYFAAGRPADAQATLSGARAAGDKAFAGIAAARADKAKLEMVRNAMIGSEHLEREVAGEAGAKALALYKAGKPAEAAPYKAIALPAYDRATTWIMRNGKEGIGSMMDVSPDLRMAELKNKQAALMFAAGDKAGAARAYGVAGGNVCAKVTPATRAEFEARKPISDNGQYLYIAHCQDAVVGQMKATGEWDQMIDDQAARLAQQQKAMIKLMYGIDLDKPAKR